MKGHFDALQTLAFFPHGNAFVAGDRGGVLRLWQTDEQDAGGAILDRYSLGAPAMWLAPARRESAWAALAGEQLVWRDYHANQTQVIDSKLGPFNQPVWRDGLAISANGRTLACVAGIEEGRTVNCYVRSDDATWRSQTR